jgi:hypothetical protein
MSVDEYNKRIDDINSKFAEARLLIEVSSLWTSNLHYTPTFSSPPFSRTRTSKWIFAPRCCAK